MIDCLIVDDEQDSVDLLVFYAKQIPNLNIVCATTNPIEALNLINDEKVELAFCDIQMPEVSGLDIAKASIGKCKLIFVTAYSDFAFQGYEHDVLDYLLKPVSLARFLTAFKKAEKMFSLDNNKAINIDEKFKEYELSKREMEVIDYIIKNKTPKEIGNNLHLATSTVNKHIANIYKKVNVNNRYEIMSKILS